MKKFLLLCCLLIVPTYVQAQEQESLSQPQAQSLLDALRESNEKQAALLSEQKEISSNIFQIRERIKQININLLGIQNNTQQIVVAHGGVVQMLDFFKQYNNPIVYGVVGFAVFGLLTLFYYVMKFGNWFLAPKKVTNAKV